MLISPRRSADGPYSAGYTFPPRAPIGTTAAVDPERKYETQTASKQLRCLLRKLHHQIFIVMSTTSEDLNYRSLSILVIYLLVCASLTGYIACSLYARQRYLRQHGAKREEHRYIPVFVALAALSLGATWYYMFSFFAYSYRDWACRTGSVGTAPLTARDIELWLRDTKLFQEAWGAVVESPWRFWWSEQIFLWTTGWSLFLGVSGKFKPHACYTIRSLL